MRDNRPPFLTDADDVPVGSGFDINVSYEGKLFGMDRMGHTVTSGGLEAAESSIFLASSNEGRSAQPMARMARKMSASNATLARHSKAANVSQSYNANTVR